MILRKYFLCLLCVCVLFQCIQAQQLLQGVVLDSQTKQPVANALVVIAELQYSTQTNEQGEFQISAPLTVYSVYIHHERYVGCTTQKDFSDTVEHVFFLNESDFSLEKIIVTAPKYNDNVQSLHFDAVEITPELMRKMPTFMGETDVLRSLSIMSGVQQTEGAQGITVQGGSAEQNLVVFDGAPLFNASHVLGFFSIFPSDIVASAQLYKSAIPAQYGGRLTSVLEVNSRSALDDSLSAQISLGILAASANISVPISKKSAISFAGRTSYLDLIVMPLVQSLLFQNYDKTLFKFNDMAIRYDYAINNQNTFSISAYKGNDVFEMGKSNIGFINNSNWGNFATSATWQQRKNNRSQIVQLSYSHYQFYYEMLQSLFDLSIETGVQQASALWKQNYTFATSRFSYGLQASWHQFNTGTIQVNIDSVQTKRIPPRMNNVQAALFGEYRKTWLGKLQMQIALRLIPYAHLGPYTSYNYNQMGEKVDSVVFRNREIAYSRLLLEPRMQLSYLINSSTSLKMALMRTTQNLHLLSMFSAALPADIWIPATSEAPVERATIAHLGVFKNLMNNSFESSVAVFAKQMDNQVEFAEDFMTITQNAENVQYHVGKGIAAGVEVALRKVEGRFTGGINYSFSRTLRKFLEINTNYFYPASHDKPHDISLYAQYTATKRLSFSAVWVFSSGRVYSEPVSRYFVDKNIVNEYGVVNNKRMPAYHRLDVSMDYEWLQRKHFDISLHVSIYNAYNRKNPYFLYYETKADLERFSIQMNKEIVQTFPILPSCTLRMNIY